MSKARPVLARACGELDTKLVTFSTDLVFDGKKATPYVESDTVRPLCSYGRTKADAEVLVLAATATALVVRTAAFFSDHDDYNFVTRALRSLAVGEPFARERRARLADVRPGPRRRDARPRDR